MTSCKIEKIKVSRELSFGSIMQLFSIPKKKSKKIIFFYRILLFPILPKGVILGHFYTYLVLINWDLPIINSDTVRWSLPAGLIAPRAVPTKTQQTATNAITAINHLNDPGFHVNNPQHPLGGSSEKRPLKQTNKQTYFPIQWTAKNYNNILVLVQNW